MTRTISSDVLFDFDRSSLDDMSDKGRSELDKLIEDAKNYRIESITVAGYTDPLGSADYNKRLSLERAKTVRDYMKQHGFPDLDIKVEGRGATDLKKTLADCPGTGSNDPQQIQCLAEDRRVQIEAMVLPK
jgi:OOP family OmpA-OmpF porin